MLKIILIVVVADILIDLIILKFWGHKLGVILRRV